MRALFAVLALSLGIVWACGEAPQAPQESAYDILDRLRVEASCSEIWDEGISTWIVRCENVRERNEYEHACNLMENCYVIHKNVDNHPTQPFVMIMAYYPIEDVADWMTVRFACTDVQGDPEYKDCGTQEEAQQVWDTCDADPTCENRFKDGPGYSPTTDTWRVWMRFSPIE